MDDEKEKEKEIKEKKIKYEEVLFHSVLRLFFNWKHQQVVNTFIACRLDRVNCSQTLPSPSLITSLPRWLLLKRREMEEKLK